MGKSPCRAFLPDSVNLKEGTKPQGQVGPAPWQTLPFLPEPRACAGTKHPPGATASHHGGKRKTMGDLCDVGRTDSF